MGRRCTLRIPLRTVCFDAALRFIDYSKMRSDIQPQSVHKSFQQSLLKLLQLIVKNQFVALAAWSSGIRQPARSLELWVVRSNPVWV
jgi:hypothetical protein